MNNIIRFLIGTIIAVVVLILGIVLLAIATPLILIGSILFYALMAIVVVIGIISFIWYMSRNETPKGQNRDYSIGQGKEV